MSCERIHHLGNNSKGKTCIPLSLFLSNSLYKVQCVLNRLITGPGPRVVRYRWVLRSVGYLVIESIENFGAESHSLYKM